MGLLDFLGPKDGKAAMRKQAQRITEKYGPAENRQKTISQLASLGTAEALSVLCLRFTIRSDPGITDDEEKEEVRRILVEAGEAAVGPVKEFLAAQESGVSWGLRVLSELRPPGEVVAEALALLRRLGREYSRDPEKKLVLLGWLAEQHGDLTPAAPADGGAEVAPLHRSTRCSCRSWRTSATTSASPPPGSSRTSPSPRPTRTALVELFLRDVDNARVRGEVLQALLELGADVKGYRPKVEALLAEPWFLDKEGRVKRRG